MRTGLTRSPLNRNLFYDSGKRTWRYRMHCPECGKCVGCRCYKKLETALDRIEDKNADFCCSAKCVLYTSTGIDKIDIKMAILAIVQKNSPIPKIEDLSEKQAQDIIDYFINIGYFDNPGDLGEECEL